MNIDDLINQRLQNQKIEGVKAETPAEAVRWMGAMQAQEYNHALWAIGLRTKATTKKAVEEAIIEKRIIRTWTMRGTLHFVVPDDVRWLLNLSEKRMRQKSQSRMKELNLDDRLIEYCKEMFVEELKDEKLRTRQELFSLLEKEGVETKDQKGYHILWRIAQDGVISMGPVEEKKQFFMLLNNVSPKLDEIPRDEALGKLAERYFTSRGPATVYDFAWWGGLLIEDARVGIERIRNNLTSKILGEKEFWIFENGAQIKFDQEPNVRFLPSFDEYLIAYKDRSEVLKHEMLGEIVPSKNGMFSPIIIVDGKVTGIWKATIRKNGVDLDLNFSTPFPYEKELIYKEANRYSDFIGLPLSIVTIAMHK
ncbi:MAG: winged helix DNA-binding domain-containing protein [Clostridiaceae bacterium]